MSAVAARSYGHLYQWVWSTGDRCHDDDNCPEALCVLRLGNRIVFLSDFERNRAHRLSTWVCGPGGTDLVCGLFPAAGHTRWMCHLST